MLPYYVYTLEVDQADLELDKWYYFDYTINDAQSIELEISPKLSQDLHISQSTFIKSDFLKKYGMQNYTDQAAGVDI